jgi:hypothetical protein
MLRTASPLIAGKQSPILLISSNIPSRSSEPQMDGPPLPRPPQLPFPSTKHTQASRKLSSTIPPFIQLQQAPHQYWIESEQRREPVDVLSPSRGLISAMALDGSFSLIRDSRSGGQTKGYIQQVSSVTRRCSGPIPYLG